MRAVDGVTLDVPTGTIFGLLGPNGAGKTTTLRMLIGIIDPSSGTRRVLGRQRPLEAATEIGYLPEERGLYPAMHAREAIAFMGALRGLPLHEGRRRADRLLQEHNLGEWAKKPIRSLSKGMAQTVQLLGTIVHRPRLIVLDEPFAGLDALNQGRLENMIRREARARLRPLVRLRTRAADGPWRTAIPADARHEGDEWIFELPGGGPEPLLRALIDGGAGIETLAIERPGLHDVFVAIAGNATAAAMSEETEQ